MATLIAPSILSADFARMGDDCAHALLPRSQGGAGADWLHVDVMDGHFVPNLTMGPDMVRCIRAALPHAFLDVHLMVLEPWNYIDAFAKAGANLFTFHAEALCPDAERLPLANATNGSSRGFVWAAQHAPPAPRVRDLIAAIKAAGMQAGIAINPSTPASVILPFVQDARFALDLVLVMSVNPGASGQAFLPHVLDSVRALRRAIAATGASTHIEMDGGLAPDTAPAARQAGCNVMVAGSACFKQPRDKRADVIDAMRTA